ALTSLAESRHLPNASTFCGRCESVCPMHIPLPGLLRSWREKAFGAGLPPITERAGLGLWGFFARRPWLYRPATRLAMWLLGRLGREKGRFAWLPLAGGWTEGRDMPAPAGRTFRDLWRERRGI
ncbi:MAG: lactate utilization protein, partial [Alphaproteobacteria bacterium]|nr:lactate utilization protein [Alphaproteobacteria bacterium]